MADCRRARHRSADSFIAVAIAFHRESPATEPAGADYPDPFVDIESADDPPIPPDPDISLPPPPPPTVDFIEAHDIEPSLKSHRTPAPIRVPRQTRLPAVGKGLGGECPATRLSVR